MEADINKIRDIMNVLTKEEKAFLKDIIKNAEEKSFRKFLREELFMTYSKRYLGGFPTLFKDILDKMDEIGANTIISYDRCNLDYYALWINVTYFKIFERWAGRKQIPFKDVYIHNLSGKKREIKEYAKEISEFSSLHNGYVMGFDRNEDITFYIEPNLRTEEFWQDWKEFGKDTKRVEVYAYIKPAGVVESRMEVYVGNRQAFDRFLKKCNENLDYVIVGNDSKYQTI